MGGPNVLLRSAVWKGREVDFNISYYVKNDPLANLIKMQFALWKTALLCAGYSDFWPVIHIREFSFFCIFIIPKCDTCTLVCEEKKIEEN